MCKKKIVKYISFVCLFALSFVFLYITILQASTPNAIIKTLSNVDNDLVYDSHLYTGLDDLTLNTYKGELKADDKLIETSKNGLYKLYYNSNLAIFKVENTSTGYIYQSAIDEVKDTDSNQTYAGFLASSFSISYYTYIEKDSNYNMNTSNAWINRAKNKRGDDVDGYYDLMLNDKSKCVASKIDGGLKLELSFASAPQKNTDSVKALEIGFNAYVTISNDGLHVEVPNEEIYENTDNYKLANIMIMPLMGATYDNLVPGYMVIPDGSGALVRYGAIPTENASSMTLNYYGINDGAKIQGAINGDLTDAKQLSAPIFGFVNGVNQDGLLGVIEDGSMLSTLTISPCGASRIKYNFMYPSFTMRYVYNMYGVTNTLIDNLNNEDIKLSYRFLSGDDADYVGIAKSYQTYLVDNGLLKKSSTNKFNTQIDFLMSESVKSLIGYNTLEMTSLKDANNIYDELKDNGLVNQLVVLKGWNKTGFSGSTPYDLKYNTQVGSKSKFKDFIERLTDEGNSVHLYNDYVVGYSRGDIAQSKDAAKSNLKLRLTFADNNAQIFNQYFYLYPSSTLKLASKNIRGYQKLGATNIALDSIGYKLFSYYENGKNYSRYDAYNYYKQTLETLDESLNLALIRPNFYSIPYTSAYLGMNLYANSYSIYTDNIPLIPYVLKGYVDYYADYLNFNAIGDVAFLRCLDYGAFPSFLLTSKISYELKYTDTNNYYTTCYDDWKDQIIDFNKKYESAYKAILNCEVVDREVLSVGVVKVTYQNLTSKKLINIYINYTSNDYSVGIDKVLAQSFMVKEA